MTRIEEAVQERLRQHLATKVHVGFLQDFSIALPRNDWEFYVLWISRHRTLEELQITAIVKSLVYLGQEQNQLDYISLYECPLSSNSTVAEARECADIAAPIVIRKLVDVTNHEPIVWRYCQDMLSATHSLAYYMVEGDSKTVAACMEPIRDMTRLHPFHVLSADARGPERILAESMYALYSVDVHECRRVILETIESNRKAIFAPVGMRIDPQ